MSYLIEIMLIIIGVVSVFLGISKYEFWLESMPGGGFMPVICGGLLIIVSILIFLDKKHRIIIKIDSRIFIPVVTILLTLIANLFIGMIPSITLMVFIWIFKVEKYSLKKSLSIAVVTGLFTFCIFGLWLNVPFPIGFIGNLI